MASDDLDPAVRVIDPDGRLVIEVDTSPGAGLGVDEHIQPDSTGRYTLIVTSAFPLEAGEYSVTIEGASRFEALNQPAPTPADDGPSTDAAAQGGPVVLEGFIDSGDRFPDSDILVDLIEFEMQARSLVSIEVTATAFEPRIAVFTSTGATALASEDTAVTGRQASNAFVPPATGTYTVAISSATGSETGSYTLRVTGASLSETVGHDLRGEANSDASRPSTSGATVTYAGTWTGTIHDSVAGEGRVAVTLNRTGAGFEGTWYSIFDAGSNGGAVEGHQQDGIIVLRLQPSDPSACPLRAEADLNGAFLVGIYSAYDCRQSITGTLRMSTE